MLRARSVSQDSIAPVESSLGWLWRISVFGSRFPTFKEGHWSSRLMTHVFLKALIPIVVATRKQWGKRAPGQSGPGQSASGAHVTWGPSHVLA